MAEIVPVVSEALEAQIRSLLPSQRGFGEDLQASNVITPIIDLTATAEGTSTPQYLQTALAFGSQTAFLINNGGATIANTAGFYRILAVSSLRSTVNEAVLLSMSDGVSSKTIWQHAGDQQGQLQIDLTVFLRSGDSISGTATTSTSFLIGSVRQVADVNGNLVNPSGFTPQ